MRAVPELCSKALCWLCIALANIGAGSAAELSVVVTDRNGDPLPDVAVYLVPSDGTRVENERREPPLSVTMEQIDNTFVPHILVVETGTEVSFPNNDTVSHHVYSFSEAKRFQLDLYRGNVHPPQLFDRPGLVVLGCNIHDSMLAYVLVVDTPWSSISSIDGLTDFSGLPAGKYDLVVWTPRARQEDLPSPRPVMIEENGTTSLNVQLMSKLSAPHGGLAGSLSWERY